MTDDRRELAEYVARWAGWTRSDKSHGFVWFDPFRALYVKPEKTLSDPALAWRAWEELVDGSSFMDAADAVKQEYENAAVYSLRSISYAEATHRALRAARGGE